MGGGSALIFTIKFLECWCKVQPFMDHGFYFNTGKTIVDHFSMHAKVRIICGGSIWVCSVETDQNAREVSHSCHLIFRLRKLKLEKG